MAVQVMATKKKTNPVQGAAKRVSRWYLDTGKEQARELLRKGSLTDGSLGSYLADKRARQHVYLRETVKDLRRYFTGFGASDGYLLRDLKSWSYQRAEQVRRYGSHLHHLQSQKHVRAVPKSKSENNALAEFTGQHYMGSKRPRAYVVPVDHPDRTDIKYNKKQNKIEIVENFKGGRTVQQFYLFRDYGFDFYTWSQLISVIRKMITDKYKTITTKVTRRGITKTHKEKVLVSLAIMPPGFYTLWSAQYGTIFEPMERDEIIMNLEYRFKQYDENFAQDLLGFRYFRDELDAERESVERHRFSRTLVVRKKQRQKQMNALTSEWRHRYAKKKASKKKIVKNKRARKPK